MLFAPTEVTLPAGGTLLPSAGAACRLCIPPLQLKTFKIVGNVITDCAAHLCHSNRRSRHFFRLWLERRTNSSTPLFKKNKKLNDRAAHVCSHRGRPFFRIWLERLTNSPTPLFSLHLCPSGILQATLSLDAQRQERACIFCFQ